jgi:hypothetical protein
MQNRLEPRSGGAQKLHEVSQAVFEREKSSVADPGCLPRIPDPDFYRSRIQKWQQKRGVKKNSYHTFFCGHKFHKIENYFIFEKLQKKIGPIFKTFTQKFATTLSKIWVWDPGSGKNLFGSRIQGSKRHRIPDPDPQHWKNLECYKSDSGLNWVRGSGSKMALMKKVE